MPELIFDLWFPSTYSLKRIASRLELKEAHSDDENYWEWVIGTFDGIEIDLTRTHTLPIDATETRIFRLDHEAFSAQTKLKLIERLRDFVHGPIQCGKMTGADGHNFIKLSVESYESNPK